MGTRDRNPRKISRICDLQNFLVPIRASLSEESGSSLVEMAISSSILFAVLFGLIYFGWAMYTYDFISDAAREGARYAIVRGSECTGFSDCNATQTQIASYVKSLGYPGLDASKLTVTAEWWTVTQPGGAATTITDCGGTPKVGSVVCNEPGNAVQVSVQYDFPISIPYWTSTTMSMVSRAQLVISQ
jgi:Flp pilus assembly protein TadG